MREVLVAVFETATQADGAVRALEAANVPQVDIRRYHKDDPAIPHTTHLSQTTSGLSQTTSDIHGEGSVTGRPNFWSWLVGDDRSEWRDPSYSETHEQHFSTRIGEGNTVVAVYVPQESSERILSILEEHQPVAFAESMQETATATTTSTIAAGVAASASGPTAGGVTQTEREQTIPLSEEQLEVGKRRIERPVHVRRYVVERPVEEQVTLRDERVEIERRRPVQPQTPGAAAFEERIVEVRESTEEPVVTKTAAVTEEVVVRRQETERTETVRDTVRKEEVEIDRNKPKV